MKVRILEIGPEDAWFEGRHAHLGKVYTCPEEEGRNCCESGGGKDWLFLAVPNDGPCFWQCRVKIVWEDEELK